jgi:hypothetical protein
MTPLLNFLAHFRLNPFSNSEKTGDLPVASNSAALGGREVKILSTDKSTAASTPILSNTAASSAAAITDVSLSKESSYNGILQQNRFQARVAKGSAKTDMPYSDVYTKIFKFLPLLKERIACVKDVYRTQDIALSYSQAIRIASESYKELSDADIKDLIEMAPAALPPLEKRLCFGP